MWFNIFMVPLLKSPLHFFISGNTMLLNIKGKKSGKVYQVPVNYLQIGDRLLSISLSGRTWWRNLRGGTDVKVRLKGREFDAHAVVEEGQSEVSQLLGEYVSVVPQQAKYFDVQLDPSGKPEDVARAAQGRVVVVTNLNL